MVLSGYRNLMMHMEWADCLVWRAVLPAPSLQEDSAIRERLYHIHSTQWVYLQVWRGEPISIPEFGTFSDLLPLSAWARDYHRELAAWSASLEDETLHKTIEFPWAAQLQERFGGLVPTTLGETILQVALHTTHHRAQVATALRAAGSAPPTVDFIAWIWMNRPAPNWSAEGRE